MGVVMCTNEHDDHYRVSVLLLDTGAGMAEEYGSTSSTDGDDEGTLHCRYWVQKFSTSREITDHKEAVHDQCARPFSCPVCSKTFKQAHRHTSDLTLAIVPTNVENVGCHSSNRPI